MIRIAEQVAQALSLDVSELLEAQTDREPQHASATKRDIDALHANLRFNPRALATRPSGILLLDDVLTTGATFVACKSVLQQNLPGIPVADIFVARRVPQPAPWPPVANEP